MILQIALGIVLAVIILYFLPAILGLGLLLILLAIGGALLYWLGSSPTALTLVGVVAVAIAILWLLRERIAARLAIKDLREFIHRRQALGYDTTLEEQQLAGLLVESRTKRTSSTPKTRRELGYTDNHDLPK